MPDQLKPAAWMDALGEVNRTQDEQFKFPLYPQSALTASAETAAAMTSRCKEVDYNWREPEAARYCATIWVNSTGNYVSASGATVWQAVQAVFAKRESLS